MVKCLFTNYVVVSSIPVAVTLFMVGEIKKNLKDRSKLTKYFYKIHLCTALNMSSTRKKFKILLNLYSSPQSY